MENHDCLSSAGNFTSNGKISFLPPKSPLPYIPPSHADCQHSKAVGSRVHLKSPDRMGSHHQRTSSASFLVEEQPSWLDELLNEPETPVRKCGGHRRSSSDSFAYIGSENISSRAPGGEFNCRNASPSPSWGSQSAECFSDIRHSASTFSEPRLYKNEDTRLWDYAYNSIPYCSALSPSPSGMMQKPRPASTTLRETERESDSDGKRAKQQFAQRSRIRKLQYIAELERNVQALQGEGAEAVAQVDFINHQNILLSMENQALKQRLETLSQEHLIKCLEHEVLEREIARLRSLYHRYLQQQHYHQQQRPSSSNHPRKNSKDLEYQFSNLSLKQHDRQEDKASRI